MKELLETILKNLKKEGVYYKKMWTTDVIDLVEAIKKEYEKETNHKTS